MNLVIDFGNSSAKAGIFEGNDLEKVYSGLDLQAVKELVSEISPNHILVSSVSIDKITIEKVLGPGVLFLDHHMPVPFVNKYESPETLGLDRIAGVAGAGLLFPGKVCLVIDMGTCITYDLLTDTHEYLGGAISPGLSMRFKAIHEFTARLPRVEYREPVALIGKTTEQSILSGVIQGLRAELEGIIDRYLLKYDELKIIMCGGDHKYFENTLKQPIFAAPELVLRGLNRILRHNA